MINWKVRLRNKTFWVTMIPAILLLVSQILGIFGLQIDFSELNTQLLAIVGTVFAILAVLGVAVDPTTKGVGDSTMAQSYETPQ